MGVVQRFLGARGCILGLREGAGVAEVLAAGVLQGGLQGAEVDGMAGDWHGSGSLFEGYDE